MLKKKSTKIFSLMTSNFNNLQVLLFAKFMKTMRQLSLTHRTKEWIIETEVRKVLKKMQFS